MSYTSSGSWLQAVAMTCGRLLSCRLFTHTHSRLQFLFSRVSLWLDKNSVFAQQGLFLCQVSKFSEACQISWKKVSLKERQEMYSWKIGKYMKPRRWGSSSNVLDWYSDTAADSYKEGRQQSRYSRSLYTIIHLSFKSTSLSDLADDITSSYCCVWWDCQVGSRVVSGLLFSFCCHFT